MREILTVLVIILALLIIGLIAGLIADSIVPGRKPRGIFVSMIVGTLGVFLGGWLFDTIAGPILISIAGAVIILYIMRQVENARGSGNLPDRY